MMIYLIILAVTSFFIFTQCELNDHMLSYIVNAYYESSAGETIHYNDHLYINELSYFLYHSLKFSPQDLVITFKGLFLFSFVMTGLLIYWIIGQKVDTERNNFIFSLCFLFFPPLFSLFLIYEDNVLYFPMLLFSLNYFFKLSYIEKFEKKHLFEGIITAAFLAIMININALNVILLALVLMIGFVFLIFRNKIISPIKILNFFLAYFIFTIYFYMPFESFIDFGECHDLIVPSCNPLFSFFPMIFDIPQGPSLDEKVIFFSPLYFEKIKLAMLNMTGKVGFSIFSILLISTLFLMSMLRAKNKMTLFLLSTLGGAFIFFALYFEPNSFERWDYFILLVFIGLVHSNEFKVNKLSKFLIPLSLCSFIYINVYSFTYRNPYNEKYKEIQKIAKDRLHYKKVYLPWDYINQLLTAALYFPNALNELFIYYDNHGECEYYGENPNNKGQWNGVQRILDPSFKSFCLRSRDFMDTLVFKNKSGL